MLRFGRYGVATALALAAGLASSGALAATVTQTTTFSNFHQLFDLAPADIGSHSYARGSHQVATYDFAAFDTSLGSLTGAILKVESQVNYSAGVNVIGYGTAALSPTRFAGLVTLAGAQHGPTLAHVMAAGQACGSGVGVGCFDSDTESGSFDFEVGLPALGAMAGPSPVEIGFESGVALSGFHENIIGSRAFLGLMNWRGQVALTYVYEPSAAAVPEPATWSLLILGFAAAGAHLRRQGRHGRPGVAAGS